ncbi:MAG: asparagine synthase-related protein [Candidatus Eremiobacteraeota bacterium]|nr:asparagine synthase-related protein [Candidatus Eremiobacteraeota bacterium]
MIATETPDRFSGRLTHLGALDPGDAAQPAEHAGCRVLCCGYIADRAALCARLGFAPPLRPSDGELLAHAFRAWGRDLQAHVLGEYAALVYDLRAQTALLTHDALGVAPLFYSHRSGGIAFATDIIDLVDDAAAAAVDDEYLADFLACGFTTSERTPYRSILRVLPGQSMWWSAGELRALRALRTWDLADAPMVRCRDDAEYEERFRALLSAGVQSARDPNGPTWVSLSGGLDSSSIASIAARDDAHDLAAYSIVSSTWPDADESRWMRAVVEQYALPWHKVEIETMLPFSQLPGGFHGEPTHAVIAEQQLQIENALLRSHGARVMLSGHAGDAVLCASPGDVPTHLADPLFDGNPAGALRAMNAWKNGARDGRSQSHWLLRSLVEPAVDHVRGRRMRNADRTALPPWFERGYTRAMRLEMRMSRRVAPHCRTPARQMLWDALWMMSTSTASVPRRRMTYAVRNPILYRPLVEFMCGIPWEQKLRPRCDRYLQRRALAGVLPELVRRRATKGTGNPSMVEGLRRSRDWFGYLCDTPLIAERGIVDADRWRLAVRQASVGQTHDDRFFLAAVAVEVWLKQLREHRAR